MKRNRILIDLERLRYPNSGIANVFRNLVLSLNKNCDADIYGPERELKKLNLPFGIKSWKSIDKYFPFFYWNYKVIHSAHQLNMYFHIKFFAQKKVLTLHDLNFLYEEKSERRKQKTAKLVRKNLKNSDVVVCISDFAKKDLLDNYNIFNLKTTPRIEVIYNGVSFPKNIDSEAEIDKFQCLTNKKFILSIGVLFPKKNQLSLLRMLPFIEEDLVLVSSDMKSDYENKILNFISENNLQNRVHFFKNISECEKIWLLNNTVAMCHPSLAEGFGIPPIEAMNFGKPVFLSNLTSLPEIGGDVAFYFENFEPEHMVSVYNNGMKKFNENKDEYILKLKSRAQIFCVEKMAQEYYKIYESLM